MDIRIFLIVTEIGNFLDFIIESFNQEVQPLVDLVDGIVKYEGGGNETGLLSCFFKPDDLAEKIRNLIDQRKISLDIFFLFKRIF